MTSHHIEFGLDTPVYVTVDDDGRPLTGDVVIRNTVEEAVLADAVGIDSFNIGEHYRPELMDSAGAVMLGEIAGRAGIRLGTVMTVLSTQDPVRVYTEFAALDAVSNGRAQLIVGRGSLTDSPAVRVRPRRLREAVRGEPRPADPPAPGPTRHLVGQLQITAHRPACQSLIATEDRMIPPDAQRLMSKRANATTVEAAASHAGLRVATRSRGHADRDRRQRDQLSYAGARRLPRDLEGSRSRRSASFPPGSDLAALPARPGQPLGRSGHECRTI